MRKLSLSLLAAGAALLPAAAQAQPAPPPPGHGMHGGMMMHHMGPMPGQHFEHRLRRGFVVPPFFFGPQFWINNWQLYGFADPGPDGRWIRYYDDAYLIDRDGRIRDSREGLDWDRYGEDWAMEDGIPAYRGSRDYRPGPEDYAWSEEHEGHGEHMEHGEMHMRHGPMPGPGYGYGGGYGYGYGGGYTQVYGGGYGYGAYAYPIVIETVTTSAAPAYSEEVVEEYVQVRRAHHRARPRCICQAPRRVIRRAPPPPVHRAPPPRPRPPAGERG